MMSIIFMNSENRRNSDAHRLGFDVTDESGWKEVIIVLRYELIIY